MGRRPTGLVAYNEAKKLSYAPLPRAYKAITLTINIFAAAFIPVMMAQYAKGPTSSFFLTFAGVFMVWFMYGVACARLGGCWMTGQHGTGTWGPHARSGQALGVGTRGATAACTHGKPCLFAHAERC